MYATAIASNQQGSAAVMQGSKAKSNPMVRAVVGRVARATLIAITLEAASAEAQPTRLGPNMTGGETAAPNATGRNDFVNPQGNRDGLAASAAPQPANANPVQPGMTLEAARQKLADSGLKDVGGLYPGVDGAWRGVATNDGRPVMAWVDAQGGARSRPLGQGADRAAAR